MVLLLAGLPAFIAEAKFSGDAFRLFRWRSPETRMQIYLETVLAREDHAKEVKLFGLGPRLLQRYRDIFTPPVSRGSRALDPPRQLGLRPGPARDRDAVRRLRLDRAVDHPRRITLGQMTMYLLLFRQGQARRDGHSVRGRRHVRGQSVSVDAVRISGDPGGARQPAARCTARCRADGVRFEHVSFTYPGAAEPALIDINLHLPPGSSLALVGENGSGKTTLIKLLTRLYSPDSGRILLDGLPLPEWSEDALRARIGVIFQDFTRYQMLVGENVGAGDERYFEDEPRWREAAAKGRAADFIEHLPQRLSHAARQMVPERPGTLGRPVAEDRAGARLHAHRAPMCWCSMSRPRPWMRAPKPRSSSTFARWRAIASPS